MLPNEKEGSNLSDLQLEIARLQEALSRSQRRLDLLAEGANDGLWHWDLIAKEISFSPRWKRMLGHEPDEIGNNPEEWFGRVNRYHVALLREGIRAYLEGLTPHFECRYRILHKDGNYLWMLARGVAERNESGKPVAMAGSQTDITEHIQTVEALERNALYDSLTGLPNSIFFTDLLERAIKKGKRDKDYLFAVLHLDLDRFKNVNDSLGHAAGNQLLIAVADRIRRCLRAGDAGSRFGGDDFVILLDDLSDPNDATRVAERIRQELSGPFALGANEVYSGASIGIALSAGGYEDAEGMLRDADTAMYRAKSRGRARHEVFDENMHASAIKLLQLEHDLRRAVERNEFEIHYQPIISLETGVIMGFEALVRWRHPERGLIFPLEFIPAAEDTGLIIPICYWVLRESCKQLREWQEKFPSHRGLSISMNFTGTHFEQPDLVKHVEMILEETGLKGKDLTLEITESVILSSEDSVTSKLWALKELDIQLHLDDFGTGYSSLSYLHRFPIDGLKIDRSFLGEVGVNGDNEEIVRTIVMLAHALGMDVVAEGVEKQEQISLLRRLECEFGQGYYFSRAVEATAAESLLEAGVAQFQ